MKKNKQMEKHIHERIAVEVAAVVSNYEQKITVLKHDIRLQILQEVEERIVGSMPAFPSPKAFKKIKPLLQVIHTILQEVKHE